LFRSHVEGLKVVGQDLSLPFTSQPDVVRCTQPFEKGLRKVVKARNVKPEAMQKATYAEASYEDP